MALLDLHQFSLLIAGQDAFHLLRGFLVNLHGLGAGFLLRQGLVVQSLLLFVRGLGDGLNLGLLLRGQILHDVRGSMPRPGPPKPGRPPSR